jgi:L-histidine Nalpha-methyltransferase
VTAGSVTVEVHLSEQEWRADQLQELAAGLTSRPREISPSWFYDARGSELFDAITRLPEYYPTRAERSLLVAHAAEIAATTRASTLIELGSGTSEKTTLLLDALRSAGTLDRYVPFDVSEATVRDAAATLERAYPGVEVHAVVGDFHRHLDRIPGGGRRLVAFLGGTIGNLRPAERHRFLDDLRGGMAADDHLLLGADLVKDPARIVAAYDDPAGVTAAFNRNALAHINAAVGADSEPEGFDHVARWDPDERWIEMRLRARGGHQVHLSGLGLTVELGAGEEIRTEISAKLTPEGVTAELAGAGFEPVAMWGAEAGEFLLTLARPTG